MGQSTPVADRAATPDASAVAVRVLGVKAFPSDLEFQSTLVGGLSGIDYDPTTDSWIAISDDRSDNNPARYYELGVRYGESGFEGCRVGRTIGTYLHGPLLPRNPWFADWVIRQALAHRLGGDPPQLEPLSDELESQAHAVSARRAELRGGRG